MKPDASEQPFNPGAAHPDQPPSSGQPNASSHPTEALPDADAPADSGTAATRAMKQTSKTVQETGTADK